MRRRAAPTIWSEGGRHRATEQELSTMKKIAHIAPAPARHWVGDGFPVHNMFGYGPGADLRSPFLMLDYGAATRFEPNPTPQRRGVGSHPHRGFETVTIVYDGEVEHRDSTGGGGVIGPGDIQWMTAGGGILHDEFHSAAYSRSGGPFEMVQLWVNLPAKDKMTAAHYQAIVDADVPAVALPDGAGRVRVIAGAFDGVKGPATTYTPMNVWDVTLAAGKAVTLPQPDGWTTLALVQHGTVQVNDEQIVREKQLVTFRRDGDAVRLEANGDARVLLLAGEPIDEPVVGYGPFVMNSEQEIRQAIADFNAGRFGRMAA
jgi:redox-sensitive bicupin YhaK (pirin superfamily)